MDATPIVVAGVMAIPGLLTGLAALRSLKRNVGTANGRGNVTQMLGAIQDTLDEHSTRLSALESKAFRSVRRR